MGVEKRKTAAEFALNASEIHNDKYDYSKVIYTNRNNKVIITCPIHGDFEQTPNGHLKGYGCYACGRNKTKTTEDDFIKKAKEIHGDFYDYTNLIYSGALKPVTIKCPLHGEFTQIANNHLNGSSCKQCSLDKISSDFSDDVETFIEKAKKKHGNKYDYSKVKYTGSINLVTIICPKHGDFNQSASSHKAGRGCPVCMSSKGEKIIKNWLEAENIAYKPQHKFDDCRNILPLPFDFYLVDSNICIEFNGIQHYKPVNYFGGEEGFIKTQKRDKIKEKYCIDNNIELLVIKYNEDITEKIKAMLLS
jgi:hypothetical protein